MSDCEFDSDYEEFMFTEWLIDEEIACIYAASAITKSRKRKRTPREQPKPWLLSVKDRSGYSQLMDELETHDHNNFKKFLRMDVPTFKILFTLLESRISKQVTSFKRPIPAKERLAIALRFLATSGTYDTLAFFRRCQQPL